MTNGFTMKFNLVVQGMLAMTLLHGGNDAVKSYVSITYDSCNDQIGCSYKGSANGECYIEYRDEDETMNVTVNINSATTAPSPLMVGVMYSYVAVITTTSNIALLIIRGNFTPEECGAGCDETRVTEENTALLAIGSSVWLLSLTAAVVFAVLQLKFVNDNHVKAYRVSRILGICGSVVLLLALPFWVAIGPVVGTQTDLCESDWKNSRESIIAGSFGLSLISLVLIGTSLLLLAYSFRHVIPLIKRHPSIFRREELVMERSSTYSNPTQGEDFTNFTVKANPVFGYDLSSSTESSKTEESSTVDVVGITNLKAELTDSASDAGLHNAAVVEKCEDAEIIGNRFAS